MRKFYCLLIAVFALSACQKNDSAAGDSDRRFVKGPVSDSLAEIYAVSEEDGNFAQCDLEQKNIRLEIALALDSRAEEIKKLRQATPVNSGNWIVTHLKAGEITIAESNRPSVEESKWDTDTFGWKDIIQAYQKIKDTQVDGQWVMLDTSVRGILPDDGNRIIDWVNYQLGPYEIDNVRALSQQVTDCFQKSDCLTVNLSPELEAFAMNIEYYRYYVRKLKSLSDSSEIRKMLKSFKSRMDLDMDIVGVPILKMNHEVSLTDKVILVQMNGAIFQGNEDLVKKYIEPVWSKMGLNIKIVWDRANALFDVFKIVKISAGERASVSFGKKLMRLPEVTRATSISHEFGHVLGLSDEYYNVWNATGCSYTEYYDMGNIMSNSSTGQVLPKHIERVMKAYFP